jgi:signal transduction histidine kinase
VLNRAEYDAAAELITAMPFEFAVKVLSLNAYATGDCVLIDVEDRCGGLPDGKLDNLFRPFEQRGVERTGLGLGLPISRRGVEANGGTLRVHDLPGTGCVFTIDLPLAS